MTLYEIAIVCLFKGGQVDVEQRLGDLRNLASIRFMLTAICTLNICIVMFGYMHSF